MIIGEKYEVIGELGRGGMGVVYKVRHRELGAIFALKQLRSSLIEEMGDTGLLERFRDEAKVMAQFNHPNIGKVFDIGRDGDRHYFVMAYVQGQSLREVLQRQGQLPIPQVLAISVQVAKALAYAHACQPPVIHRDIKPENILIEEDSHRAVVMDFGISKLLDPQRNNYTRTGLVIGTVMYGAPEQLGSDPNLDGRVDIFSLGLVMYEMITGQRFFAGLTQPEIIGRQLDHRSDHAPEFKHSVPMVLQGIVTKAMAKDRNRRYSTALELVDALANLDDSGERTAVVSVDKTEALADRTVSVAAAKAAIPAGDAATVIVKSRKPGHRSRMIAGLLLLGGAAAVLAVAGRIWVGSGHWPSVSNPEIKPQSGAAVQPPDYRPGQVLRDTLSDGTAGPELVVIRPGEFPMGSPESEKDRDADEKPHGVRIDKPFALGKYEVAVGEFRRFAEATQYLSEAEREGGCYRWDGKTWEKQAGKNWRNPGFSQDDGHPVVCASWNDAVAYADWLTQETGHPYRLPTEAEWEYAARAGTKTIRYWGDNPDIGCRYANAGDLTAKQTFPDWDVMNCEDGYLYTAPVGRFQPNAWNLYDMLGNVWEWTCSGYDAGYSGGERVCLDRNGATGPRVLRGGSWDDLPRGLRAAYRLRGGPGLRNFFLGFRLARDL